MFDKGRQFDERGYCLLPLVVSEQTVRDVCHELDHSVARSSENNSTRRNILEDCRPVRELSASREVRPIVDELLGRDAFPIRGILFDKLPLSNWQVGWHQDQIIPVAERRDTSGFTAWSEKQGVAHVRPPVEVLEKMLVLRIHLDDAGLENGPLRVISGSHCHGFIEPEKIRRYTDGTNEVTCAAQAGDVLAMRPLLLHASSKAKKPGHRRVIHLEYAVEPLPGELQWYDPLKRI